MFSSSPNDEMNLDDSLDGGRDYNSLLDPGLQSYFDKEGIREHLVKAGLVTESGRIVCTLKELNDYRRYLAKKQARTTQMRMKAEYEEEKRQQDEKRREEASKREKVKDQRKTQNVLQEQIKGTIRESKKEVMMAAQMERDKRIINRRIKLQEQMKQRASEREEKFAKLRAQRGNDEYQREIRKKEYELEMAIKDVQRNEKLCKRKEEERLERKRKLEEFWDRKAAKQAEWFEKGFELERKWLEDREENVKARMEQVGMPEGKDGEVLGDKLTEKTGSFEETDSEEKDSARSSKETTKKKTVTPTSSTEITLDQLLRKEFQSTASYETLRGNPSREEMLTPVSSKEITLEDILREETESRVLIKETQRKKTVPQETGNRVLGKKTSVKATARKETGNRVLGRKTSIKESLPKEVKNYLLSEETSRKAMVPKETENRVVGEETSGKETVLKEN